MLQQIFDHLPKSWQVWLEGFAYKPVEYVEVGQFVFWLDEVTNFWRPAVVTSVEKDCVVVFLLDFCNYVTLDIAVMQQRLKQLRFGMPLTVRPQYVELVYTYDKAGADTLRNHRTVYEAAKRHLSFEYMLCLQAGIDTEVAVAIERYGCGNASVVNWLIAQNPQGAGAVEAIIKKSIGVVEWEDNYFDPGAIMNLLAQHIEEQKEKV